MSLRGSEVLIEVSSEEFRQRGILDNDVPVAVACVNLRHSEVWLIAVVEVAAGKPKGGVVADNHIDVIGGWEHPLAA